MKARHFCFVGVGVLASIGLQLFGASASERAQRAEAAGRPSAKVEDPASPDYVLQPQDVLRIYVFQHDDINKQTDAVSLSQESTINLPLIKTLNLKGRTVRQCEEMIRAAYDKDYLVNPQVSVIVVKYAERMVNVIGAVNSPGRIAFPQEKGLTIVEAISLAGGPNRYANMSKVKLTRKDETIVIDVDAMIKGGSSGRDVATLQRDDVILVPERVL